MVNEADFTTLDGTVGLDQDAYIAQLVPIAGPSLFGKPPDEEADAALQWALMSLFPSTGPSLSQRV